jgi:hypothetical protein
MSNSSNRSWETIEKADLSRLADLSKQCIDEMLGRAKTGRYYPAHTALMACLCQGAAQHYVHGDRGVQDLDVVFFFRTNPRWKFPPRWRGVKDFGPSRFGRNPDDGPTYSGRRVDVLGRDIPVGKGSSPVEAVIAYLREGRTTSARLWAQRPLVVVSPKRMLGRVIWDGKYDRGHSRGANRDGDS